MFYDRLKDLCEKKGISLRALSDVVGIGKSTMGAWRDGASPNSNFVLTIAEYFDVSCDYLLGRTSDPTFYNETSHGVHLSEDELFYIEKLRECDIETRQKILITGLVFMGGNPDRDQLPSLRNKEKENGYPQGTDHNSKAIG